MNSKNAEHGIYLTSADTHWVWRLEAKQQILNVSCDEKSIAQAADKSQTKVADGLWQFQSLHIRSQFAITQHINENLHMFMR
jgi:hypothetical protein